MANIPNPGDAVRLRSDPGRVGSFTGKKRERGGRELLQIRFPDAASYVPLDQLELMTEAVQNPLDLMSSGQLFRAVDLRRCLTHVRLTGKLADVIYSMGATNTDFYAYQFKPLLKLLQSASQGILIADEVGLGKTIESGLIWTELRTRFDFRRLMVLCPAALREKWRLELKTRFGVDADIVTAGEALSRLRQASEEGPYADFALIASLQGLRSRHRTMDEGSQSRARQLADFLEERQYDEPLVDLTIIDEAHYLRNPETATARLGRSIRAVSEYMILLSATPIHLRSDDLFHLLSLVDAETFNYIGVFKQILEANRPLVKLREEVLRRRHTQQSLTEALEKAQSNPLLKTSRKLATLIEDLPSDKDLQSERVVAELAFRLDTLNLLGHVISRTRKRDVTERRVVRTPVTLAVTLTEVERAFYDKVTETVRKYACQVDAPEAFMLATPQRQMSSCMPAALRYWQSRLRGEEKGNLEHDNEDLCYLEDTTHRTPDSLGLLAELVEHAASLGNYSQLKEGDSKYDIFRQNLAEFFREYPNEHVIVFSFFRATLAYLDVRLREEGYSTFVLHGGVKDKESVIRAFRDHDGPAILLSSEVGSEGIDLQFAWLVVNYDLPWNPMRVEQRIGRVDRIGQMSEAVRIWNLIYDDTIDSKIYERLFKRLKLFEWALGALEGSLGEKAKELEVKLLRSKLTSEEEERLIEQTAQALENKQKEEEELEGRAAELVAYGDYIIGQVDACRELSRQISGTDLRNYVTEYLRLTYPGASTRQAGSDPCEIEIGLCPDSRYWLDNWMRKSGLSGQTALVSHRTSAIACRFENSVFKRGDRKTEIIGARHPLVRAIAEATDGAAVRTRPAVAVRLRSDALDGTIDPGRYAFAVQRWSISGIRHLEKLDYQAVCVDTEEQLEGDEAERLVVAAAREGHDWIGAANAIDISAISGLINNVCLFEGDEGFEAFKRNVRAENEDRADLQLKTLQQHRDGQLESLEKVLNTHKMNDRPAMVKVTQGRIRALNNRVDLRIREIQARREATARHDEIAVGVVELG